MSEPQSGLTFLDIRKAEFALAAQISSLQGFATQLGVDELIQQLREMQEHLEQRRFSVAVVGEFKRGKSTFINALLGKEILPADILPATATLNRVTYGPTPFVRVHFFPSAEQQDPVQDVPIAELGRYVAKLTPDGEAMAARVREAVVYYPLTYCENNVDIIDTPGLNDNAALTRITLGVLPHVDAAIMVIMARSPFSAVEGAFLNTLLTHALGGIFFVVTAIDQIRTAAERERALQTIHDRIVTAVTNRAEELFGKDTEEYHQYLRRFGQPRIFALSGYDALEARVTNDQALLVSSGFQRFEQRLSRFLTEERGAANLRAVAERFVMAAERLIRAIDVQQGTLQMQNEEFDARFRAAASQLLDLRTQASARVAAITAARSSVEQQIQPYLHYLVPEMINAADTQIDAAEIDPAALTQASVAAVKRLGSQFFQRASEAVARTGLISNESPNGNAAEPNEPAAISQLNQAVAGAVAEIANFASAEIHTIIQAEVATQLERTRVFATEIERVLAESERSFMADDAPTPMRSGAFGMADSLLLTAEIGELWNSNTDVGLMSAALGSLKSLRGALNDSVQGIISVFSGTRNQTPSEDRVTVFKQGYRRSVHEEINRQVAGQQVSAKLLDHTRFVFERLAQQVNVELEQLLAKHDQQLVQLRRARELAVLVSHRDQEGLGQMRQTVREMLRKTYQLSEQLVVVRDQSEQGEMP